MPLTVPRVLLPFLLLMLTSPLAAQTGRIEGRVFDESTGLPLPGAIVVVRDGASGTVCDDDGRFSLVLPTGAATVEIRLIGYAPWKSEFDITEAVPLQLRAYLTVDVISLREITVTPGRFAIMGDAGGSHQVLSEEEIQSIPQFGEDIFRAVTRLPGVAGSDYSAKFTVRGGEQEEVLVRLDGVELFEPFHLKDINGGALSIVDVGLIESVDLLTGGFSAEYGDRLSGVFDVRSRSPEPGQRRASIGLSMMNTRAQFEGAGERSSWLVSARRGYLDIVLALMGEDEDIDPRYSDLFAKYTYELTGAHHLQASLLRSRDDFDLMEDDDDESNTGYGNTYGWLSLTSTLSPALVGRTTLSAGRVSSDRVGVGYFDDGVQEFVIRDERDFDILSLRQDWSWEATPDHFLKWGFDLRHLDGYYDYLSDQRLLHRDATGELLDNQDTTAVALELTQPSFSLYAADRLRLTPKLTAELGLRYDDIDHTDDRLVSPRLSLVYALGSRTHLRAAWGRYHQSQAIHQLRVEEGQATFLPAERSEHRVVGLEHLLDDDIHLRIEAYDKQLSSRQPKWRNWLDDIEIFPELQGDRIRLDLDGGRSRGLEVYLKRDADDRFTWWLSYALAEVRDDIRAFGVGDQSYPFQRDIPGRYDQRHTVYADLNYRPSLRWHLNLAWQYRSGWPYTLQSLAFTRTSDSGGFFTTELGEPNGRTYPAFHRLDARLNRAFRVFGGEIHAFFEVTNLYDHGNVSGYEYNFQCSDETPESCGLRQSPEYWFRLLPSLGFNWSWDL
ncbi:MAG TPA: TonB-dependent receptor [Candidatus Latescibacteria bacterium]|nr:TonB-dependent receptor [Candidatus Latescibacterota bacterium]HJP30583.1 TonB-dependent receptor [Candidatus Latescibacterota bacterium]